MTSKRKRVAIVGGGYSGMMCVNIIKEEGLNPVCFEKTDKPGGTWCYRDEAVDGISSIMPTTILNHSKEIGAISNFPPRKECANYMRHAEQFKYFNEYWTKFDTLRYVKFCMEVVKVTKSVDYEDTGSWQVTVRNTKTDVVSSDIYDNVIVCAGQFTYPRMPSYAGQDDFKGKIIHSHELKHVADFKGKNVLVVGMGCSALDAAVESSTVAKQVYLSTRTGSFIVNRVGPCGYPFDYVFMRRCFTFFLNFLPVKICSNIFEKLYLDMIFNRNLYRIKPMYHVLQNDPVVNDHIISKFLTGSVEQVGDIDHFTEQGVVFKDDHGLVEVDVAVMATGYSWKFPFLEEDVVVQEEGRIDLYKCIFPPRLKFPTFAVVGFILPFGPGFPIGELQARWVAQVFSGNERLPSFEVMMDDIRKRHCANELRYCPSDKMTIRVDFVQYMDEIASQFGAKPNFMKLFFTDIVLLLRLWFGPCVPYQYRLQGPHTWNGAREAIMTCKFRVLYPLTKCEEKSEGFSFTESFRKLLKWFLPKILG